MERKTHPLPELRRQTDPAAQPAAPCSDHLKLDFFLHRICERVKNPRFAGELRVGGLVSVARDF
jgi:hypothetical protein